MQIDSKSYKLTQYSHGAGCGCKISPKVLDIILNQSNQLKVQNSTFLHSSSNRLLVGNESRDDAAVMDIGNGEAIICNRLPGVRAAVYHGKNLEIVRLSREHNNANILSLGARFVTQAEAEAAVALWLQTPFSGEARHERRIRAIEELI